MSTKETSSSSSSSSSSSTTADAADAATATPDKMEDWELQRDACKLQGDTAFRSGNFAEAIRQYTSALELDPAHHVLLSNRSAAHLKMLHKSKALKDANACIAAKPDFTKGYSRLASAQQSLGRWRDAIVNYERVLKDDPNNAVAKRGLEDCQKKQRELDEEQETLEKKDTTGDEKGGEENGTDESVPKADGEDDLLGDFFDEVEEVSTKPKVEEVPPEEKATNIIKKQKADLGTSASQIERLLAPNFKWRNLNPFFVLDIPHNSTEEDISKRYKALSLLLHPDKCRDLPRAKEAYDEVQKAKTALNDQDKRKYIRQLVEQGRKNGKHKWTKEGSRGDLPDMQEKEVQRIFAEIEFKRQEIEKRERKHEQREREQEEEEQSKEKKTREFDKKWRDEGRVGKRIGNWRQFQNKKSKH